MGGPSRPWRLLVDQALPGALNMALDKAVLRCVADGSSPPTLRMYAWERPTVSLGRFQPVEQVDLDAARRHACDVVRRPTGGRGVLHDDEVTYALVCSTADGVPRGTAASYAHLSAPLADAYAALGVEADLVRRDRGEKGAGACYLHTTRADLSAAGAKLSGSAQVWSGDAVLQHGSIVVSRDVGMEKELFRLDDAAAEALEATTATLATLLPEPPEASRVVEALRDAVACRWGIEFVEGSHTTRESAIARAALAAGEVGVLGPPLP